MNIVNEIESWVAGWRLDKVVHKIHDDAEHIWTKINPDVQELIKDSSAAVHLIELGLTQTPQFVVDIIKDKTGFTPDKLHNVLTQVSKYLSIASDVNNPDLVTMVGNIQAKMKEGGQSFDAYREDLSNWIALHNTPQTTTFTVIASVMKFVFTTFIKGKFAFPTA